MTDSTSWLVFSLSESFTPPSFPIVGEYTILIDIHTVAPTESSIGYYYYCLGYKWQMVVLGATHTHIYIH